jgi:hypothetical protein
MCIFKVRSLLRWNPLEPAISGGLDVERRIITACVNVSVLRVIFPDDAHQVALISSGVKYAADRLVLAGGLVDRRVPERLRPMSCSGLL